MNWKSFSVWMENIWSRQCLITSLLPVLTIYSNTVSACQDKKKKKKKKEAQLAPGLYSRYKLINMMMKIFCLTKHKFLVVCSVGLVPKSREYLLTASKLLLFYSCNSVKDETLGLTLACVMSSTRVSDVQVKRNVRDKGLGLHELKSVYYEVFKDGQTHRKWREPLWRFCSQVNILLGGADLEFSASRG